MEYIKDKIFLFFIILIIALTAEEPTWTIQNTLPTTESIRDIYIIDPDTALIFGDECLIMNTEDGG